MVKHLPTFAEIEAERAIEGIAVRRLCIAAGCNESGYFKLRAGKHQAGRATRKRLAKALVKIKREDAVDLQTWAA